MAIAEQFMTRVLLTGFLAACIGLSSDQVSAASTTNAQSPGTKAAHKAAVDTALRYTEAIAKGDRVTAGQLDFACQYRLVTSLPPGQKNLPETDRLYDTCWQEITASYPSVLRRSDTALDTLWPVGNQLAFYGDTLLSLPPSAFVMDVLGLSPPGTGLHLSVTASRSLPQGSFPLKPNTKPIAVPTTSVDITVHYHDCLSSPVAYGPGMAHWTSTTKRERRAVKSIGTRWVVLSGLKRYGFSRDTAVFHTPVETKSDAPGMVAPRIPFTTETSRAIPDSIVWWGPQDQPGALTVAAARVMALPDIQDRVALLNRVLIIDPTHVEALNVLTKSLYTSLLRDASHHHNLVVKDPALARVVNEFYWNIHAANTRFELSYGMDMGGFREPTSADYLYRLIPALETLAKIQPEQLENRLRLGTAYRWNNDQFPMIATLESLLRDIPADRPAGKAEVLIQLAWSRINKVSWNRILHDPDSVRAYEDAKAAEALAELPLDKFLAEYTMAYSMIFLPNYGDKSRMLQHLTEAKRWYDAILGKTDDKVWRYFLETELLKAVLDADPIFEPILATVEEPKE